MNVNPSQAGSSQEHGQHCHFRVPRELGEHPNEGQALQILLVTSVEGSLRKSPVPSVRASNLVVPVSARSKVCEVGSTERTLEKVNQIKLFQNIFSPFAITEPNHITYL